MLASLVAAVVAALCYGIASVMQAVAVRGASNRSRAQASAGGIDPGLVPRMLSQWRFVVSVVIDLLGFIAQLVALRRLPLFAVQAVGAAHLAVGASHAGVAFKIAVIVATAVLGLCGLAAARLLRDPARTLALGTIAGFGFRAGGIAGRRLHGVS